MFGIFKYARQSLIVFAYFILNFSMLCGGNFQALGPFSLRHLSMFFLIGVAVLKRSKVNNKKCFLPLYIIYIFVYTICNLINGEYITHSFLQSLYTYHLPCIAVAVGLPALIRNIQDIKLYVYSLIALYAFDSILSVFQYMNSGFAWLIATMISNSAEEGMERTEMYTNAYDGVLGFSLVAGAFGFVVTNGYFLATYLSVLTYRINKKGLFNVTSAFLLLVVGGCVIFVTQQRMAFLSFVLVSCYIIWYGMGRKFRIPLIVLGGIFLTYYGISNIEMGRLTSNTNNDTRMRLFDEFFDFLMKGSSLFGGAVGYLNTYGKAQHNTFLSAWVLGGIFTFVVYVLLYFKLLKESIINVFSLKSERFDYPFTLCFAIASIIFLLYSITHSSGVQTGSPMFWVVYVMMCLSHNIERKENAIFKNINQ